ncbi:MAG: class II aldolase/adducin family protein [Firmicutes bacterium]|nr:class II aldolase/adducin family protein [Bacillota bacterium]
MKDSVRLRQDVIDTCLWLKSQGLVFSTWGNISVRLDDGNILITPSKLDYDIMVPDDLVVLAPDGTQVSGTRLSTSEREIHRNVMKKRGDVGAIIHMHSPYAMMAAARNEGVPVISEEMCQLLGGAIPLSREFVPSDMHERLGQVVTESVTDANAILIRNHGPVCLGKNLAEARVCCQVVEKSCKMYIHLLAAGGIQTLSEEYVKRGRDYFLNGYGKT